MRAPRPAPLRSTSQVMEGAPGSPSSSDPIAAGRGFPEAIWRQPTEHASGCGSTTASTKPSRARKIFTSLAAPPLVTIDQTPRGTPRRRPSAADRTGIPGRPHGAQGEAAALVRWLGAPRQRDGAHGRPPSSRQEPHTPPRSRGRRTDRRGQRERQGGAARAPLPQSGDPKEPLAEGKKARLACQLSGPLDADDRQAKIHPRFEEKSTELAGQANVGRSCFTFRYWRTGSEPRLQR